MEGPPVRPRPSPLAPRPFKMSKWRRFARLFRVKQEQVDQTLAAALRQWMPHEPSWGDARRLVRVRHVLVNGNLCLDETRRLKKTDVIKVLPHPAAAPPRENDVVIRFLDKHVVVVNKPSGMTSVRHAEETTWSSKRKQRDPTLEDLLPRIIAKREDGERSATYRGEAANSAACRTARGDATHDSRATCSSIRSRHQRRDGVCTHRSGRAPSSAAISSTHDASAIPGDRPWVGDVSNNLVESRARSRRRSAWKHKTAKCR